MLDLLRYNLNIYQIKPENNNSKKMIEKFGKKNILDDVLVNYIFLIESESLGSFENKNNNNNNVVRTSICQNQEEK